ncbi:sigma-70 family RNA polymerase sigma factor [Bradyrhizobium sp. U87765 SZCCT0131]|nr:sigma-70 family RNA polymerase sigma factor [Bradyrhizobium sp. U87765 SZCCT0131]MBR1262351.1 sigma-70 family RNA polymerase sigma factor [Bradyrhizobium sp. U87765 SZCCT0134]MBR1308466.1 sigma-70 family RNA polymerase sigma factor [Bradyrhizobium sp. U87765 SZCCT0110]MBR1318133.1 sigma-70 family RNA polymerase sigma factor [Bradyrhizobium sp. U87765 SZCCT0109]MBR1351836.1 sigma-70 family RNA polymerase sigma factor [Bradyrhizobium sp. U87765 SZCCT0048]
MSSARDYASRLDPLLARGAGYARALLRDRHNAEDAVQQAALRGLERFDTFDRTRSFKAWWFAILHNCCIDLLRQKRRILTRSMDGIDLPDGSGTDQSAWERLDAALRRLAAPHQEILRLRYFGDMSYRELAEALQIPAGTVMSRLHLARKALAERFHEEDMT